MGLKFGANLAAAAMMLAGGTIGVAAPMQEEPPRRKQPKRVTAAGRVLSQVYGGLMGDAFVTHTFTPKPLGKRARRRLRGRIKEQARLAGERAINKAMNPAHQDWYF